MDLLRSSIYTFVTKIILFAFSIVSSILVVKMIGAEGKGILTYVQAFFGMLITLSSLSLGSGLIYYASKSEDNIHFLNSSLLFGLIVSTSLFVIFSIFVGSIENTFFGDIPRIFIFVGLGFVFIEYIYNATNTFCRAKRKPLLYNGAILFGQLVYIIFIFVFWFSGYKLTAFHILLLIILGRVINVLFTLIGLKSLNKIRLGRFSDIKQMAKFGLKVHLGLISQQANLRFDIILLGLLLTKEQIGYYSIAVIVAELVWYIPDSVGVFLYPKLVYTNNAQNSASNTAKINRITLPIVIIVALILFWISSYIIPLMYGDDFISSVTPLRILLIGSVGLSVQKILMKYFGGIGKPIISSYTSIVGLITNLPLLFLLLPKYGIMGAALAKTITYVMIGAVSIFFFKKHTDENYSILSLLLLTKNDINEMYYRFFPKT